MIIAKLDKFRNEALIHEHDIEMIKNTRSIEACRKEYQKKFLKESCTTNCCPHCGAMTKTIVLYKSRFIYEGYKNQDENGEEFMNVSCCTV